MTQDVVDDPDGDFPNLTPSNHCITSPSDTGYNCIAWAVHDSTRWWQPGHPDRYYWPLPSTEDAIDIEDLRRAYEAVGFVTCDNGDREAGFDKVAIYSTPTGLYTHAARQLTTGKWTSKLGYSVDIEHDTPDDVAGGAYGIVAGYMRRPLPAA